MPKRSKKKSRRSGSGAGVSGVGFSGEQIRDMIRVAVREAVHESKGDLFNRGRGEKGSESEAARNYEELKVYGERQAQPQKPGRAMGFLSGATRYIGQLSQMMNSSFQRRPGEVAAVETLDKGKAILQAHSYSLIRQGNVAGGMRAGIAAGIARAAGAVIEAFRQRFEHRQRGAAAQIQSFNATEGADPVAARAMRASIDRSTRQTLDLSGQLNAMMGNVGDIEEENSRRVSANAAAASTVARNPGVFGIDPHKVRREIAARKGKGVANVTDYEVRQELQARGFKKTQNTNLDSVVESQQYVQQKDAESIRRNAVLSGIGAALSFDVEKFSNSTHEFRNSQTIAAGYRTKIREEVQNRDTEARAKMENERRERMLEETFARMSDEERLQRDRAIRQGIMADKAAAGRYKMKWDD